MIATKLQRGSPVSSGKTQPIVWRQAQLLEPKLEYMHVGTTDLKPDNSVDGEKIASPTLQSPNFVSRSYLPPVVNALVDTPVDQDSTPLQVWEGVVNDVDHDAQVMQVVLTPRMRVDEPHTADIELQWVADQDLDLVKPGAVFYLTLFKRTTKGSISNSQELRFRRLPSWSKSQMVEIDKRADALLLKMRASPVAE